MVLGCFQSIVWMFDGQFENQTASEEGFEWWIFRQGRVIQLPDI